MSKMSEHLNVIAKSMKFDLMGRWIEEEWMPAHPDQDLQTLWIHFDCVNDLVLKKFDKRLLLPDDYGFKGYQPIKTPVTVHISAFSFTGDLTFRTGAFLFEFEKLHHANGHIPKLEVLVMASYFADDGRMACIASVPKAFMKTWAAFSDECARLARAFSPSSKVYIIGGRSAAFVPSISWDEVILPAKLKAELLEDVESFFTKGVGVYKRLNIKPFRKLLLAGVPGTGKTMLCSALAKWAIDRDYLVIYISSADQQGATFGKIQQALAVAAQSKVPTLILLEELDAYLHKQEKALVLNVLDGSESFDNEKGSLLIATTNYPEVIDERIMKRPGRLDRIFIIPETRTADDAEKMLRKYLGIMWNDEHLTLVPQLVGFPGAFIREVAVYALTQVAYTDLQNLPLDLLQRSFDGLKEQMRAKEEFLTQRNQNNQ
ncbi:MAG: ATP-binding protein [Anaerolineae bacterium]